MNESSIKEMLLGLLSSNADGNTQAKVFQSSAVVMEDFTSFSAHRSMVSQCFMFHLLLFHLRDFLRSAQRERGQFKLFPSHSFVHIRFC